MQHLAAGTLRGVHKTGLRPGDVLALLNERLHLRGIPQRHTAIQYAVFDPATALIRIASAGMPGSLLLRGTTCLSLKLAGIPPGLLPGVSYEKCLLHLQPGDSLIFCTDGLTEARNSGDQEFGIEGMCDVCCVNSSATPFDLLAQIFARIEEFSRDSRQSDDMTAAVFQFLSS
jgi:sigma-B regulation protein RsbU (phosphoserine phosphatase)